MVKYNSSMPVKLQGRKLIEKMNRCGIAHALGSVRPPPATRGAVAELEDILRRLAVCPDSAETQGLRDHIAGRIAFIRAKSVKPNRRPAR
jgi:hypothetical protein